MIQIPEASIIEFIREHHVLTLATCDNNTPWCCNCFYSFIENEMLLVVASDEGTRHVTEVTRNHVVAGSIVLETSVVGKIQGIQFTGLMTGPGEQLSSAVSKSYLMRFPFAILKSTKLWVIELQTIKMTDNRLGFGKKLKWGRDK